MSGDLSNRYNAPDRFYRGTRFADDIENTAMEVAKRLYRCKFASVKPLSGHTCSLIVTMTLLAPGDKIVTCPPKYGGYPGSSKLGMGPLLSLKNLYFPFDPDRMNIIPKKTNEFLSRTKAEMTIFGSSYILFPYEIEKSLPRNYRGYTIYDGSHVMGLIAGGRFQDPLREGASVLIGSTHKTLFGPQGGLILSNDSEIFSSINDKIFPGIVDNIHLNRVASLTWAMLELLKFGRDYSYQVIRNSKALAFSLSELGVPVKCKKYGFTESHQVLLDFDEKRSTELANEFEKSDIITDVAIRLGTSEITRKGMKVAEMEKIAQLISDIVKRKSSKEQVQRTVHGLVEEFSEVQYKIE